jgi:hypothetical protein
MSNVSFLRHNSFFAPDDTDGAYFNIIGVGATGSWAGLLAAKMGWHNFRIWDLDVVESHNCPNQAYDLDQVGMKKVDAFEATLKKFNPDITVEKYDCFFESEKHADLLDGYVFIAVDSNSARKDIFTCIKDNIDLELVFETKMGFNHASMDVIDPFDQAHINSLLESLVSDEELQESACNARIMTTLTTLVASCLVHTMCNYASAERRNKDFTYKKKTLFSLDQTLTIYNP